MPESLFDQYKKSRSADPKSRKSIRLRNQIVEQNQLLARDIAHRMEADCPEPYEDLEQIAMEGLIRAIEKFDPDRGVAFSSFAVPYIRGEIQHFLRDNYGNGPKVPRREIELSSRAIKLTRVLGIEMDEAIVARGLGVSAQKLRRSLEARSRKPVKSLDEIPYDPVEQSPVEQDYSWLKVHIASLPEPTQSIVLDRYLRGKSESQIARSRQMELTEVQTHLESGLLRLKAKVEKHHGNPCSGV